MWDHSPQQHPSTECPGAAVQSYLKTTKNDKIMTRYGHAAGVIWSQKRVPEVEPPFCNKTVHKLDGQSTSIDELRSKLVARGRSVHVL